LAKDNNSGSAMQNDITEKVTNMEMHHTADAMAGFIDSLQINVQGQGIICRSELKVLADFLVSSFLLISILEGEIEVHHQEKCDCCTPGTMYLFVPFQSYTACSVGKDDLKFIYLNFDVYPFAQRNSIEKVLLKGNGSCLDAKQFRSMAGTLTALCRPENKIKAGSETLLRLYIDSLLIYILRDRLVYFKDINVLIPDAGSINLVNKAVIYTENHLSDRMEIVPIAKAIGVSKSTLYNAFIDTVSVSPSKFLTRYKMKKATQMLQDQMPMKEIADILGYSSISHFSNTFKEVMGLSPSKWKRYRSR
jgi:AraC-like DNA-binding protein